MAASARPEPVGLRLEPGFPLGFQRVTDPALVAAVRDNWNSERPQLCTISRLGYVNPLDRAGTPCGGVAVHLLRQLHPGPGSQRDLPVDPGRLAPSIQLRCLAH